jgi:hypothetical protein
MEQRQKMQASSIQSLPPPPQDPSPHSSDTKEGDSEKPSSMMVEAVRPSDVESSLVSLRVLLNGHMHVLVGQPGTRDTYTFREIRTQEIEISQIASLSLW